MTLDKGQGAAEKRHWVRLSWNCNQRCLFCHDRGAQGSRTATLEEVRRDLAQGRKQGMRRVVLSGGEPTLNPDFLKIIRLARKAGYTHIQAISNGRRFCYPEFLDAAVAAGLDEITFSLHGHTAALHDRLTRTPGSFVQAMAALRRALATAGLVVSVDVVINSANLPVLRELLEAFIAVGVREFDLLALVPFGDAWRNRQELFCDFSQPGNLAQLRRALELSRRPDLHIFTNRLRPAYLEGFEALIQAPEKILDEVRGRRRLFARYLAGGEPPACAGPACAWCFLEDFCKDLKALLASGRLPAKAGPLCRKSAGPRPADFRFGKKPGIVEFAEFFIRARHFAKGSRCRGCALGSRCGGMSVREIKEKGFRVLRPVRRARG